MEKGRESEGSTAGADPEDRGGHGLPPEQWKRRCPLAIAQQLVYYVIAVSTAVLGSHKDNVHWHCTAVE